MIPAIADHFIKRAKQRAPWLINLEDINNALDHAWLAKRPNQAMQLMKHGYKPTQYLIVPKLSPNTNAVVIVISDKALHTVYRVDASEWASGWLNNNPEKQRLRYR